MNREDEIERGWGLHSGGFNARLTNPGLENIRWLVEVCRGARSLAEGRVHFDPTEKGDRGRSLVIHLREVLEEKP